MPLTERRKADREEMAKRLIPIIVATGATVERDDDPPLSPRAIWLKIKAARGLCLTIDLDGNSPQPGTHVLSWHGVDDGQKLSPGFAPSVNSCHWHKATDIAEGFEELCNVVRRRLEAAADGSAFQ